MPKNKPISSNRVKLSQKQYDDLVNKKKPKIPLLTRTIWAFVVGGLICMFGQFLIEMFKSTFDFDQNQASSAALAVIIFIGGLLTGLGYFDKIATVAGAGISVPVTGFANAMVSTALEYKREGLIYGIGSHMFSLAGSVIIYGVLTAFVIGVLSAIF